MSERCQAASSASSAPLAKTPEEWSKNNGKKSYNVVNFSPRAFWTYWAIYVHIFSPLAARCYQDCIIHVLGTSVTCPFLVLCTDLGLLDAPDQHETCNNTCLLIRGSYECFSTVPPLNWQLLWNSSCWFEGLMHIPQQATNGFTGWVRAGALMCLVYQWNLVKNIFYSYNGLF